MLRVRETWDWPKEIEPGSEPQGAELLARIVLEEGEGPIEFVWVYSVYRKSGLIVHVCGHRRDTGFTMHRYYYLEKPEELRMFFGPKIVEEVFQKLARA